MAIVRYTVGKELTLEQKEEARQRIQEAAMRPYTYDPDSPLLTEKQLAEFRPVHFDSMEERAQAMRQGAPALADEVTPGCLGCQSPRRSG